MFSTVHGVKSFRKILTVIKYIIEVLFEMSVSDLSSVVTLRNVIEERHGIMLIQVVDYIYKSTWANLAWDATSITEVHV